MRAQKPARANGLNLASPRSALPAFGSMASKLCQGEGSAKSGACLSGKNHTGLGNNHEVRIDTRVVRAHMKEPDMM